jgi:hypothetical protein
VLKLHVKTTYTCTTWTCVSESNIHVHVVHVYIRLFNMPDTWICNEDISIINRSYYPSIRLEKLGKTTKSLRISRYHTKIQSFRISFTLLELCSEQLRKNECVTMWNDRLHPINKRNLLLSTTCFDLYINHLQVLTIKPLTYRWMLHNGLHS